MEFKVGEIVKIMTLEEACRINKRTPDSYNRGFFDQLSNKTVKIRRLRENNTDVTSLGNYSTRYTVKDINLPVAMMFLKSQSLYQ